MKKRPGQLPKVNKKIVTCYVWDILSKIDFKSNPVLQSCHPKAGQVPQGRAESWWGQEQESLGSGPRLGHVGMQGVSSSQVEGLGLPPTPGSGLWRCRRCSPWVAPPPMMLVPLS